MFVLCLITSCALQAPNVQYSDNGDGTFNNPVIFADVPDPDITRVGDTFYMVSTTMHYSPGCTIMKSKDLVNWTVIGYAYDYIEQTDSYSLRNGQNDYANGSWAANIRYDKYEERFYVIMTCNTTATTYIFSTKDIEHGPWHRSETPKCYDPALLFADNGTSIDKYVIYPSDNLKCYEAYMRTMTTDANGNVEDVVLGYDDLTGYLKRTEPEEWTFIRVPALRQRADGSYYSTCERVMGVPELLKMKEQDPYKFYSMYQQEPIQTGGTFFHESDFQYYQSLPQKQQTFIATDFAFKKEQSRDRTCLMHLGLGMDNNVYLLDYIAFRDDVVGVAKRFVDFFFKSRERDPNLMTIIVEKSIANMALIPILVAEHPYMNFAEFSKAGMNNKIQYIKAAREFFLGKRVFFPEDPKPTDLINETLLFSPDGSAEHDDLPDCLSQGLHWIFGNMQQNSIFI